MRIAFVLTEAYITPLNGIVSQALSWKAGLEDLGHVVDLINMWNPNKWGEYDIIHYFGFSSYMAQHICRLKGVNSNIVVSPILDPYYPVALLKCYAHLGMGIILTNYFHSMYRCKKSIKQVLVRSEFEKKYMIGGFKFSEEQCSLIPLICEDSPTIEKPKEDFCFHCSLLADKRKNVKRLIDAAKKFNFKLILGGHLRNEQERNMLQQWIGGSPNIEYRGFLSREEMMDLYARAKVFALPSLNEGVGIVALEAASMGCNIVLTSLGGPKEYYNGLAKIVNPLSVDQIGTAVVEFLQGDTFQPALSQHIRKTYSTATVVDQLVSTYQKII